MKMLFAHFYIRKYSEDHYAEKKYYIIFNNFYYLIYLIYLINIIKYM